MESEKLSSYFKYNIMTFKVMGTWFDMMNLKQISYLRMLYNVVAFTLFLFTPQVCHVIYMYKARDNIEAFADEFYVSLSSLMVIFKSYTLTKYFKLINSLIDSMDDDIFQPKNIYQKKQTKEVMGKWKNVYMAYTYLDLSFCLMYLISTLIDSILSKTKLLPLVDCYPFPIFVSPTYEFMFLYQALVLFSLCWQNYNLDTLVAGLLWFCALQCDILCDNLKNLKLERERGAEGMKKLHGELIKCIEHYNKIHKFVKAVEFCFAWNILQQFASSVITLCTTMFKLSTVEPMSSDFFTVTCYQMTCFLQVFIFCWAGSDLAEKSGNITSAACHCDWVNATKGFKSILLNFMQRTQRPLLLNVVMFPLTLDMFVRILKSSFSYYTMLRTLNEK